MSEAKVLQYWDADIQSLRTELEPTALAPEGAKLPLSAYVSLEFVDQFMAQRVEDEMAKIAKDGYCYVPPLVRAIITRGVQHDVLQKAVLRAKSLQRMHAQGRLRADLAEKYDTQVSL